MNVSNVFEKTYTNLQKRLQIYLKFKPPSKNIIKEKINNLEKIINRKSRLRPMLFEGHVAIGWEWDRRFKIMLHFKHKNEPEKGMHIAIQHFTGRNWRRTIPDIPIKSLGKVFINWVKKFLK